MSLPAGPDGLPPAPGADARRSSGALTAQERIALLLDPGSFEDLDGGGAADSVIAGRGAVNGRAVFVYAGNFAVRAGALDAAHAAKIVRTQDHALEARAPIIGLFDSGGVRLGAGLAALAGYGDMFQRQIRASGVIPQISLILGPCAGAGAFAPALGDFMFMTENAARLFATGPAIVRAVAGEAVTADELGGAGVHAEITGLSDRAYANDFEALLQTRRLLDFLPASAGAEPPDWPCFDDAGRIEPALDFLVPDDPHQPYDMMELIRKSLDEGDFFELKPAHARNIITGFGRVSGRPVGVVASQPLVLAGVLDADAARKAARFVRFCDGFSIPIVTFVDAPGFLPGLAQEHGGLVGHVAQLIFAYGAARAPKVTVILRNALGGAGLAMGSKFLGADVAFAWPTARIALTGAAEATPRAAVTAGAVDAMIEPRATRREIARALAAVRSINPPEPL